MKVKGKRLIPGEALTHIPSKKKQEVQSINEQRKVSTPNTKKKVPEARIEFTRDLSGQKENEGKTQNKNLM